MILEAYKKISKLRLGIAFGCSIIGAIFNAYTPLYTSKIIESLALKNNIEYKINLKYLFYISLLAALCNGFRARLFSNIGEETRGRMAIELFNKILNKPMIFFDSTTTGDLNNYITHDIPIMAIAISCQLNVLLRSIIQLLLVFSFLFYTSARLTFYIILIIPLSVFIQYKFGEIVTKKIKEYCDAILVAHNISNESFNNITIIKGFNTNNMVLKNFTKHMNNFIESHANYTMYNGTSIFIITIIPQITSIMILYNGHKLGLDTIQLLHFFLFYNQLVDLFKNLQDVYFNVKQINVCNDNINKVILHVDEDKDSDYIPDKCEGLIEFKNITFAYNKLKNVLDNYNMLIYPNEHIGIIGDNGKGKSTIIKLIKKFYKPLSGEILLDNYLIININNKWYHNNIVFVPQEPVLLIGTIKENICYNYIDTDIINVCKSVDAHDFILKQPYGYNTKIIEKGASLSGGQKQKIALARAIIRNPKILLLDEATSALDHESENNLLNILDTFNNMTIITIAHKKTTIDRCSRLIKL
jgi:ABC-type bacteriocin/lantibiotic exporter with double-glycine peptidase domain